MGASGGDFHRHGHRAQRAQFQRLRSDAVSGELLHERVEPFSRQVSLRQVHRSPAKNFDLPLEQPDSIPGLSKLGRLSLALTRLRAVIDRGTAGTASATSSCEHQSLTQSA